MSNVDNIERFNAIIERFNSLFIFKVELVSTKAISPQVYGKIEYGPVEELMRYDSETCWLSLRDDPNVSVQFEDIRVPEEFVYELAEALSDVTDVDDAKARLEDEELWLDFAKRVNR